MERRLIDTATAAAILGVKPGTVRDLAYTGKLTRVGYAKRTARYGRPRALYDRHEVESMARQRMKKSS
jgi:hypothetical protein